MSGLDDYLNKGTGRGNPERPRAQQAPTPQVPRSPYQPPSPKSYFETWFEHGTTPPPKPGPRKPLPPPTIGEIVVGTIQGNLKKAAEDGAEAFSNAVTHSFVQYSAHGLPEDLRQPERTGPLIPESVRQTAGSVARAAGGLLRDAVVFVWGQMHPSPQQAPHQNPSGDTSEPPSQHSGGFVRLLGEPREDVIEGEFHEVSE